MSEALTRAMMNPANPYFGEYVAELDKMRATRFGELSADDQADAALRVGNRHLPELLAAQGVAEGRIVDPTKIPPAYLASLNRRGVSNDDVVEIARRLRPDLSPAQALAAWTEKAAKMPDVDLEYGDARQPGAHYIPGRSHAEESEK